MVWRYPAPGLTNPDTKETKTTDEYFDIQLIGETFPIFWGLTQDWHLVPGHLDARSLALRPQAGDAIVRGEEAMSDTKELSLDELRARMLARSCGW